MRNDSVFRKRFQELEAQAAEVEATNRYDSGGYLADYYVNDEKLLGWGLKARHLISMVCTTESEHYKQFVVSEQSEAYTSSYTRFKRMKAVFLSTKEDYEGGYLNSLRNIVQAEVFGNELEQARELLSSGYITAAAVVAGVVLETNLRQMCEAKDIIPGNLNKMNADLAKAGAYNLLTQKRITALADIRNNAAHGYQDRFNKDDVKDMISKVEDFVMEHL
ncbi:DUF4145 domain-containing protein [Methylorubrum extorquens]|uniref:Uncharacterized protein n=1 Tax=Methylorubrum extorquens DSM 13060 TaxID=882800 RepID=H1KI22_METEX|nr:DUF4145 domain-containing protein [Methylorubrum extorquens]EHP92854.1 hypothetical protein MetexDRAFT_2284 [Methylorubrum extorquens DSM 13060]